MSVLNELEVQSGISIKNTPEYSNTGEAINKTSENFKTRAGPSATLLTIRGIQAMMPHGLHRHRAFHFVIASARFTPSTTLEVK